MSDLVDFYMDFMSTTAGEAERRSMRDARERERDRKKKRKYFFNERRERSLIKYMQYIFLASCYNAQP